VFRSALRGGVDSRAKGAVQLPPILNGSWRAWVAQATRLSGASRATLLQPAYREWLQQPRQPEPVRLHAIEDCLDNVRREQRESQDRAEVTALDALSPSHFTDRGVAPLVQHALRAMLPGQRRHNLGVRAIGNGVRRDLVTTINRRRMPSGTRTVILVATVMPRYWCARDDRTEVAGPDRLGR
jgi:hypothetical protein